MRKIFHMQNKNIHGTQKIKNDRENKIKNFIKTDEN